MRLSTKIFGLTLILFLICMVVMQVVGQSMISSNMHNVLDKIQESMVEIKKDSARDLLGEIKIAAGGALLPGETTKFEHLNRLQSEALKELQEFTFINDKRIVEMSSDPKRIGAKIPEEIWEQAEKTKKLVDREDSNYLELYSPLHVTPDLVRFYPNWKVGSMYGLLYVKFGKEKIQKVIQNSQETYSQAMGLVRSTNIIMAIVSLLVVGVALFWIVRTGITIPIQRAVGLAETIRAGDLSQRLNIKTKDEIGQLGAALDKMADGLEQKAKLAQTIARGDLTSDVELASEKDILGHALREMTASLNSIIGQINDVAIQVANGSREISDASQQLSQGATESAASIEEISASMTELGTQAKTNAENAAQANRLAASAREGADRGNASMTSMVKAMEEISESSKQIAKIIKVIDDIAFQTNLLALNAAVEAARAGRHGKGFAVVAEEVRNLAGRSAKAARETADLIEGSVKKVQAGTEIANATAEALKEIVAGITKVTDLVGEIAAASNEQAQGVSQVNEGLAQIDKVTQQNTATAEETASAAEELSSQSAQLRRLLDRFRLKGHPSSGSEYSGAMPASGRGVTPPPSAPMTRQLSAATPPVGGGGWGGVSHPPAAPSSDRVVKPSDVIALDDTEFGKY